MRRRAKMLTVAIECRVDVNEHRWKRTERLIIEQGDDDFEPEELVIHLSCEG